MTESDKPLAALRAMLGRDPEAFRQAMDALDRTGDRDFLGLLSTAFLEIVDRTFGATEGSAVVVEWVAKLRSKSDASAEAIDPDVSEQVILFALGRNDGSQVSGKQVRDAQLLLLPLLVHDQQLDNTAIDELLALARTLTLLYSLQESRPESGDRHAGN